MATRDSDVCVAPRVVSPLAQKMPGDIDASASPKANYNVDTDTESAAEPRISPTDDKQEAASPEQSLNGQQMHLSTACENLERRGLLDPEVDAAWTSFLNSVHGYDHARIEKWTSELDNLLVFAGLFSAVVTAYTIESYSWLQEDPADTTNKLLLQMSVQMASFSLSPGFVNSTAPPAPLNITSAVFQPDRVDVTINMLWFLSLTLSLLAAFFAIACQQWLRALPLPQHLPVLDSVQLWNYRTEHLIMWQMPNIIALLPVALQISVVLFLVGLYHLLRTLDHPITTAYAVIAGVPFCMYAISLPLPLLWPHCPYKSPLVPSTVFLVRWCMLLLLLLAFFLIFVPSVMIQALVALMVNSTCGSKTSEISLIDIERSLFWPVNTLGRLLVIALESDRDFWTKAEIQRVARKQEKYAAANQGSALARAPGTVAPSELGRLVPCLRSLPSLHRTRVVVQWMTFYFGTSRVDFSQFDRRSPVNVAILGRVDHAFADAYTRFMLDALPTDWRDRNWVCDDEDVACILIMLTWVYKDGFASSDLRRIWAPQLLTVCESQELIVITDSEDYVNVRYPTVCLFMCVAQGHHRFSADESRRVVALAIKRIQELMDINERLGNKYIVHTIDFVLGIVAVSLYAASQQESAAIAEHVGLIHELLESFDLFLNIHRQGVQYMAQSSLDQPQQVLMITRQAMKSTVDSLLSLAQHNSLPMTALSKLVESLSHTCASQRSFEDAMSALDGLSQPVSGTLPMLDVDPAPPAPEFDVPIPGPTF